MNVCHKCGHKNADDAKSCQKCSRSLVFRDTLGLAENPRQLVGKLINGKYRILGVLGEGGMGVVYKARHLILQKRNLFALKVLHPKFSGDASFQKRFMREVEVAMELTHENIVQIREFGLTQDNLLFFTMDFFAGKPLSEVIRKDGRFSPARAMHVARCVLLALIEAHRIGVVHRDLKPENILVSPSPHGDKVRILDFGIAKVLESGSQSSNLTKNEIMGTPKYMSPEQASGESIDARSDLYSLGVVLYEMIAGKTPFSKGTARSILLAHLTTSPPSFREVDPSLDVPSRLESFIFRLLEKDPSARPATAEECIALLDGKPLAKVAAGGKKRKRARKRRRPSFVALLLTVLVAGGLAAGFKLGYLEPILDALAEGVAAARGEVGEGEENGAEDGAGPGDSVFPWEWDAPPPVEDAEPPVEEEPTARFQCLICEQVFEDREMPFNRHHGEPMVEYDGE